jgi:geranylgeranyl diphosphate synthase type I
MSNTESALRGAAAMQAAVDRALEEVVAEHSQVLAAISPDLADLIGAASDATAGGKRLRPVFCYWAHRVCGGSADDPLVGVATSLELLHAAALVHDDIIDGAELRRGRPSSHRQFGLLAQEWRRAEDTGGFGVAAALLLGDLLLMWADQAMANALTEPRFLAARPWYDAMRDEVVAGAYLELVAQARRDADPNLALRILTYKSAKYTVERPLQIGAALAGANPTQLAALGDFGLAVGECFQLRDDLAGIFGAPERLGKPVGIDLQDGRCPSIVARARARADAATVRELDQLREFASLEPHQLRRLRQMMVDLGAVADFEHMVAERWRSAEQALQRADVEDVDALLALRDLGRACCTGDLGSSDS